MKKNKNKLFVSLTIIILITCTLIGCSKSKENGITIKKVNYLDIVDKYEIIQLGRVSGGQYYLITVNDDITNIKISNYVWNYETQSEEFDFSVYISEDVLSKSKTFVIQGVLDSPVVLHQYYMMVYGTENSGTYKLGLSDDGIAYLELISDILK